MWSYLCFMMHVEDKQREDLTAPERYFRDYLNSNKGHVCFPIKKALALSKRQVDQVVRNFTIMMELLIMFILSESWTSLLGHFLKALQIHII